MTPIVLAALIVAMALMYVLGARTFASMWLGALTTVLFASTPLLWQHNQYPAPALFSLPFIAGWLVAIAYVQRDRAAWWAVAAGGCLGAGIYTSTAAAVMMPLYLLLTIAVLHRSRAAGSRELALMIAACCLAAAPFAIFLAEHPQAFRDAVNAHHLYDANRFNLRQGIREMTSWLGLTARTEVYYDYFNPAFLFLSGQVLLLPLAVLLPLGVYHIVSDDNRPLARLSVAGVIVAPFAAALTADAPTPARMLFVTPFAAIVSAYGVKYLLSALSVFSQDGRGRRVGGVLDDVRH